MCIYCERYRELQARVKLVSKKFNGTALETLAQVMQECQRFPGLEEDGETVSYAAKPGEGYSDSERRKTTLGRFIVRQLGLKVPNHMLQGFVAQVTTAANTYKIEVVSGRKIENAYKDSYGVGSCMTDDCARFVVMYGINPKVNMALYADSRGRQARALLWNCDDKTKVLDRIFPNDRLMIGRMQEWAGKEGLVTRVSNQPPETPLNALSDGKVHQVTLELPDVVPFLDTFSWGSLLGDNKIRLQNTVRALDPPQVELLNTDGQYYRLHDDKCLDYCYYCDAPLNLENIVRMEDVPNGLVASCIGCFRNHHREFDGNRILSIQQLSYPLAIEPDDLWVCRHCYRINEAKHEVCQHCR